MSPTSTLRHMRKRATSWSPRTYRWPPSWFHEGSPCWTRAATSTLRRPSVSGFRYATSWIRRGSRVWSRVARRRTTLGRARPSPRRSTARSRGSAGASRGHDRMLAANVAVTLCPIAAGGDCGVPVRSRTEGVHEPTARSLAAVAGIAASSSMRSTRPPCAAVSRGRHRSDPTPFARCSTAWPRVGTRAARTSRRIASPNRRCTRSLRTASCTAAEQRSGISSRSRCSRHDRTACDGTASPSTRLGRSGFGEYTYRGRQYYHGVAVLEMEAGLIKTWREYQYGSPLSREEFMSPSR